MSTRKLFLGVDGGGTKTEFVCIDEERQVVATARTGTTYHLQVGLEQAVAVLNQGIDAICGGLSITPDAITHTFVGLPAYGEDAIIDPQLHEACGRILGHQRYTCDNDMVCGWAGSLGGADGINLVAGTGSIGYGERQGRAARVGGWGELFSDEGSAYWIAIQGLNAFTRMSDGRLARGPLHSILRSALDLTSDLDICMRTMGERGMGRDQIASLAQHVSDAANENDAIARQILERAGAELATMAGTLRTQLAYEQDEPALLSWSGGVLTRQDIVQQQFNMNLASCGLFQPIEPRFTPAVGAALQAIRLTSALRASEDYLHAI